MTNLKKDMIHGVFWSAVEKYSVFFVNLIVSMVLARLITPEEFGVVATATVIILFLSIFSTMGIGPAIIQRKDLNQDDYNSIFTFSVLIGLILSVIFFSLSWSIADFYNTPLLAPICQLLSINVFFSTLNMVPAALMAKNKRFKEMARFTLIIQIIVGSFAAFAAYCKMGVFALLISPIITSISIFFVNTHFYKVKIRVPIDSSSIKKIFSFSFFQFAFDFVNYFSRNLDKLIIGKFISSEALGYYDKSYRLMQMPAGQLTGVINPVLQPVMSTLQNDKQEMALKYNKIIKFIASISIPLSIYLFFIGPELIIIFFGTNWKPAIPSFQFLAISLASQMILSTSGGIWQSCNATNYLFGVGLTNTIITITGFFLASFFIGSIESIALSWTITAFINFLTTYIIMYKKVLKSSIWLMLKGLKLPMINGSAILFILFVLDQYLIGVSTLISFSIKTSASLLTTLLFFIVTKQFNINWIKKGVVQK